MKSEELRVKKEESNSSVYTYFFLDSWFYKRRVKDEDFIMKLYNMILHFSLFILRFFYLNALLSI